MERSRSEVWVKSCFMTPDQTHHTTSTASSCGCFALCIGHQGLVHFFFGSTRGTGPLPRIRIP
uniref:Uncharacterized protein n=1 Tax=Anguilla anguilla TaxID=7936 RepID=A0A0E9Y052_ANGAN